MEIVTKSFYYSSYNLIIFTSIIVGEHQFWFDFYILQLEL